jgi:hypothetical protein
MISLRSSESSSFAVLGMMKPSALVSVSGVVAGRLMEAILVGSFLKSLMKVNFNCWAPDGFSDQITIKLRL